MNIKKLSLIAFNITLFCSGHQLFSMETSNYEIEKDKFDKKIKEAKRIFDAEKAKLEGQFNNTKDKLKEDFYRKVDSRKGEVKEKYTSGPDRGQFRVKVETVIMEKLKSEHAWSQDRARDVTCYLQKGLRDPGIRRGSKVRVKISPRFSDSGRIVEIIKK